MRAFQTVCVSGEIIWWWLNEQIDAITHAYRYICDASNYDIAPGVNRAALKILCSIGQALLFRIIVLGSLTFFCS